jgi:hypothetical protein
MSRNPFARLRRQTGFLIDWHSRSKKLHFAQTYAKIRANIIAVRLRLEQRCSTEFAFLATIKSSRRRGQ